MSFADRLANGKSEQILTDGQSTITYGALDAEFARLDELWCREASVKDGVVAFAGQNNLGTAVAALHHLVRERSCYFWRPAMTIGVSPLPWSDLPEFCTTALSTVEAAATTWGYQLEHRPSPHPRPPVTKSAYFYLGTSGTTARPKLAVYTAERLLGNAENCVRRFELTAADRVLLPLPIAHMYGLGAAFLPAILAGAAVCLLPQTNLLTFLEAERRFQPTVVFLTPGLAHQLVTVRKQPRHYRLSVLGADRMNEETFARYEERHGCTVCVYGSTELGAVAASSPHASAERRRQSSGPLLGYVRLVRHSLADHDNVLGFEHPFAMAGYANENGEPELPAEMNHDGVYLTRDMGTLDEHGDLRIHGRIDDCVKRDGYLVSFSYVEQCLEQLPEIGRVIVLAGPPSPRGTELIAFCVPAFDYRIDAVALRDRCHALFPAHVVPDRFCLLESLPLTATGKPDRQALRSMYAES